MKIIDLFNKISNGEEVPKKIKYQNYIYEYQHRRDTKNSFNYICNENGECLSKRYYLDNILNEEVEILEEEKKIPEKIRHDACWIYDDETNQLEKITLKDDLILNKLDDIIDYLDYLKSKGE